MTDNFGMKFLTVVCAMFLISSTASSLSIGAGPSDIDFKKMLKGGYGEEVITVSTAGDEDLTITIEAEGAVKDWISLEPSESFNLPPKGRKEVRVVMTPPLDAANGEYEGALYVRAAPTTPITEGVGTSVGGAVKIGVAAEVTGDEIVDYRLREVRVADTEIGFPIRFNVAIQNNGNVMVTPTIHIEIYDRKKENLLKAVDYTDLTVLPTKTESVEVVVPSKGLDDIGKYIGTITSELGGGATVEFNIWERGTLALKGILNEISLSKIWVKTGEIVEIHGNFVNRGELLIDDAKLTGQAYVVSDDFRTEQLVEVFESDLMAVPVNRQVSLTAYFKPPQPGRYLIRGQVVYGGKKTPTKESILNVLAEEKNYTLYYIGVGVLVILMVYYLLMRTEDGRTRRFKKVWGDYLKVK